MKPTNDNKKTTVRKAENDAEEIVDDAANGAQPNPQHSSLLKDQRDRTTGADQASRDDMSAEKPGTLKDTSGKSRAPKAGGKNH